MPRKALTETLGRMTVIPGLPSARLFAPNRRDTGYGSCCLEMALLKGRREPGQDRELDLGRLQEEGAKYALHPSVTLSVGAQEYERRY